MKYKKINDKKILDIYLLPNKKINNFKVRKWWLIRNKDVYKYLLKRYKKSSKLPLLYTISAIKNGLKDIKKCKICGKYILADKVYCSKKCCSNDYDFQKNKNIKSQKTKLKNTKNNPE